MPEREDGGRRFSRREFFSSLNIRGGNDNDQEVKAPIDAWRLKLSRREFINSLAIGSSLILLEVPLYLAANAVGIPAGNASTKGNKIYENPVGQVILGSIVGPINEEILFRAIPSGVFASDTGGMRWDVGLPSSLVYALAHNLTGTFIPTGVSTERVPITQFVLGLFYWKMVRDGGLANSLVAHSANNASLIILARAAEKAGI